MKKILFHINSLGKGGAERVVAVLAKYFVNDGYQVVVTTQWQAEEEYELDEKIKRINVGLTKEEEKQNRIKKIIYRIQKYRKVIKNEKPDIVISFCAKANFRSAFALSFLSIPLLVSVRNDPEIDYAPYKFSTKFMQRKASGCVFQTQKAKEFFDVKLQKKSKVIWNPLSEKFLDKLDDNTIADNRRHIIVTVGRITKQKNQLLLVKAFEKIQEEYNDFHLYLYGDDSHDGSKEIIEEYIIEHHLQEKVLFMGLCDNLHEVIGDASLFVLPSDYEGMPNALLEAMAMGLPVISTDCPCGGPSMMIQDGVSGLLVPVQDQEALEHAMVKILSDSQFASMLSKNAKGIIELTRPDIIYQQWKNYVEQLLAKR